MTFLEILIISSISSRRIYLKSFRIKSSLTSNKWWSKLAFSKPALLWIFLSNEHAFSIIFGVIPCPAYLKKESASYAAGKIGTWKNRVYRVFACNQISFMESLVCWHGHGSSDVLVFVAAQLDPFFTLSCSEKQNIFGICSKNRNSPWLPSHLCLDFTRSERALSFSGV